MRILYTIPTCPPAHNGLVTRFTSTVQILRDRGDEILIVTPSLPGQPATLEAYPILSIPSLPLPIYPGFRIGLPVLSQANAQVIAIFRPEIVHAIDPVGMGWLARHIAHTYHIPFITSYHTDLAAYTHAYTVGFLEQFLWEYLRAIHRGATLTLCPSRHTQTLLQKHHLTAQALWPGGVDLARFHPRHRSQGWRSRLTNGRPDRCILLYIGRIASEKHLETLFEAFLQIQANCHLALVGDGPQLDQFRYKTRSHSAITFLGRLSGMDLAYAYASADIFCMPSPTETFGNATIEAMASGLPVVAAAAGGTTDVITHGETGLLYPPNAPETLSQILYHLAEDPQARERLGKTAYLAAQSYSWQASTHLLYQHYLSVLSQHTPLPEMEVPV